MTREELRKLGLSEEQIDSVLDKRSEELKELDELKRSQSESESIQKDLEEAKKTINALKSQNQDNDDLQNQIEQLNTQLQESEEEREDLVTSSKIERALIEAGAADVDYAKYKLGDLETDGQGNIIDLENRIKDLKESIPSHFENAEPEEKKTEAPGYRVGERRLKPGSPQPPKTMEEIMEIKDSKERQQAIKDNGHLFK